MNMNGVALDLSHLFLCRSLAEFIQIQQVNFFCFQTFSVSRTD